jgi:hypothetical protein
MTRFCLNCKWHGWGLEGTACVRPLSQAVDPVTGAYSNTVGADPHIERRFRKTLFGRVRCGPEGKFWEPEPPAMNIRRVCKECGR